MEINMPSDVVYRVITDEFLGQLYHYAKIHKSLKYCIEIIPIVMVVEIFL